MRSTPTLEELSATLQNHAVFAVIAQTLDARQPPSTPEGSRVLHEHYLWAKAAYERGACSSQDPSIWGRTGPGHLGVEPHARVFLQPHAVQVVVEGEWAVAKKRCQ